MIKVKEESSCELLVIELSGVVTETELRELTKQVEECLDVRGTTRIMCVLNEFLGFHVRADWARVKWQIQHMSKIDCVAIVGPEEEANALALVGVTTVDHPVEVFEPSRLREAVDWLKSYPHAN